MIKEVVVELLYISACVFGENLYRYYLFEGQFANN